MVRRSELYLDLPASADQLYIQRWTPKNDIQGTLLLTHGVAEHSDCHHLMADALSQKGYEIIAWDLPGHGRSYGQRGYVSHFGEYIERLQQVVQYTKSIAEKDKALILFGHSMGGLITFSYGLKYLDEDYHAMALSGPAFGVKVPVPTIKDQAARLLNKWAPKVTIKHQINYADLSRDKELISSYGKDPLRHKKFSAPLYLGLLEAMEHAHSRAHLLKKPIFIQAGGEDRVTCTGSTKKLFEKLSTPQKELKIYPDSYHEIFNDINRQEVVDDLLTNLRQF